MRILQGVAAFVLALALMSARPALAERITVSLDGTWEIEDSVAGDVIPSTFRHAVPVPGLANLSQPPFPDVDRFDSREAIDRMVRSKEIPATSVPATAGIPRQNRNFFWYRKTFKTPARKEVAILKVAKAQFGTAVWLNGHKISEHLPCFSAGYFDLTAAMKWEGENELIVRVGAHPAALPPSVPAGTDFEKRKWTPGIYDSVSLFLCDNPVIETVQVSPRIAPPAIIVQTKIKNHGKAATFDLQHRIKTWKEGRQVGEEGRSALSLKAGEEKTVIRTMRIPKAVPWSPENPFLHVLETSTGGDSVSTRFGMREFRCDTATQRCYLNRKVYYLRGSNITLHRFFEDPKCGALPWDEKWVRKLLADIPKNMHWNSFRFCIGPAPDRWLDIADEAGLLIQNEFFIWTGPRGWHNEWDSQELIREYSEWMRDNWNHPSVVIWDANNETKTDVLGNKVIPAVRGLDLSNRPWENGYNAPAGPNDVVENHPYEGLSRPPFFDWAKLETMDGFKVGGNTPATSHAMIINEYGWLWLNRDGTPTVLTEAYYEHALGRNSTAEQRFSHYAYLLSGLTEYWRAHRRFAGVLHFCYLTASYPGAYTSDHFADVEKLELEPHFADYVGESFKPLGVYLRFWRPTLPAGSDQRFTVMMINDEYEPAEGELTLAFEDAAGKQAASAKMPFALEGLGQQRCEISLRTPGAPGKYLLKAKARPRKANAEATVSRRTVEIVGQDKTP
ncbi:hypothetical protein FJY63_00770 [Candidatus Sumerlaeota bacterium]|nr:hypothetical protein [Candidatus Sumerlaeota bacterium]